MRAGLRDRKLGGHSLAGRRGLTQSPANHIFWQFRTQQLGRTRVNVDERAIKGIDDTLHAMSQIAIGVGLMLGQRRAPFWQSRNRSKSTLSALSRAEHRQPAQQKCHGRRGRRSVYFGRRHWAGPGYVDALDGFGCAANLVGDVGGINFSNGERTARSARDVIPTPNNSLEIARGIGRRHPRVEGRHLWRRTRIVDCEGC